MSAPAERRTQEARRLAESRRASRAAFDLSAQQSPSAKRPVTAAMGTQTAAISLGPGCHAAVMRQNIQSKSFLAVKRRVGALLIICRIKLVHRLLRASKQLCLHGCEQGQICSKEGKADITWSVSRETDIASRSVLMAASPLSARSRSTRDPRTAAPSCRYLPPHAGPGLRHAEMDDELQRTSSRQIEV